MIPELSAGLTGPPLPVLQMYDNIASLRFNDGDSGEKLVSAMISAEGEVMELRKIVRAEGRVEDWMTAVLNEMRRTNRLITKEAIFRYCEDRSRQVCECERALLYPIHSHNGLILKAWSRLTDIPNEVLLFCDR